MKIVTLSLARLARALMSALGRRRGQCVAGADVAASGAAAEEFAWPALNGRLLPVSYARAELRCVLPVDAQGRMGLGFDLEAGGVVRLSLDLEGARHLAELVALFLRGHERRPEDDAAGSHTAEPFGWSRGREQSLPQPVRVVRDSPPGQAPPSGPSQPLSS